jgi:hypothetical protein
VACTARAAAGEDEAPELRTAEGAAAKRLDEADVFAIGFAGFFLGAGFARLGIVFLRMAVEAASQFLYRNLKLGQSLSKRKALKLQDSPHEFGFAGSRSGLGSIDFIQ